MVDESGNAIGVIDGRDMSITLDNRNRRPSELPVQDGMPPKLSACAAEDDNALQTREHALTQDVCYKDVEDPYKSICAHAMRQARPLSVIA